MKEQDLRRALSAAMRACPPSDAWKRQTLAHTKEGKGMKTRISAAFVLTIVTLLLTVTALAAALISAREVVENVAVPLAQQNDQTNLRQESYTHEELAELIKTLNENGFTLEEDSQILRALASGQGYWEEETIMEICRQAFGGPWEQWTVEEKYWFESMMVSIGFADRNAYLLPEAGDFSVPEARAHAAALLQAAYGADLPQASDAEWRIDEWLYAAFDTADGAEPASWRFDYVRRATGACEYVVRFLRDGTLIETEEAGFHGALPQADSFGMAERLMGDQYGSMVDWPLAAWVQFGDMIAFLTPETQNQWLHQHAGYCLPPEGSVSAKAAEAAVLQAVGRAGAHDTILLCCTDGDRRIYKVDLRYAAAGGAPSVSWCGEVDCLTGEVLAVKEYVAASSPMMMQFAPFALLEAAPSFEQAQALREAVQARDQKFREYERQYQTLWYFWPLEAQKEALGPHHDLPQAGEMTREQAIQVALNAITAQLGPQALTVLGDYQVGAICCRYPESEGIRIAWEIYVTSDPVLLSNGYRVDFDDPAGVQYLPVIEVQRANAGNG